jgi:hypothetical protein
MAGAGGKRELIMRAEAGVKPRRGVAKTFAGIAAPAGSAPASVGTFQLGFAPLRAPTELTWRAGGELFAEHVFPAPTFFIRETHPGEVEQLVDQDALELPAAGQHFGVEENEPARNRGGRGMGTERAPHLDADRAAQERRQHGLAGGRLRSWLRRQRLGRLSEKFHTLDSGLEALGQILEPFGHVRLPDLATDGVQNFVYGLR